MKKWEQKEKSDALALNGRRNKGSGNRWYNPGDVRNDKWLIDCKQTDKKSYALKAETWDKIYEEALFVFRTPALSLKIQDTELVVISKEDFLKLIEQQKS